MINPGQMKNMKKLMKQMDVSELDVQKVVFELPDKDLVFDNPSVSKMTMMGQETYQVIGTPHEEEVEFEGEEEGGGEGEEDLQLIMEKTGVDLPKAQEALETAGGDLAQAISDLES